MSAISVVFFPMNLGSPRSRPTGSYHPPGHQERFFQLCNLALSNFFARNSFGIHTYSQTPRFDRNQPQALTRKSFRIRTYKSARCNPFRIRTYEKTGEGRTRCQLATPPC